MAPEYLELDASVLPGAILPILVSCYLRQNLIMWPRSEISILLCQPLERRGYRHVLLLPISSLYFILFIYVAQAGLRLTT